MPADPYKGHAATSLAKAKSDNPENFAPADRLDYDPTDPAWANFPGAAARAAGYPRDDGPAGGFSEGARGARNS